MDLKKWAMIHVNKDTKYAQSFLETVKKLAPSIGIDIAKPVIRILNSDHARLYCKEIEALAEEGVQIVVLIFPSNRDDRYASCKKLCNATLGLASQVR